MTTKAHPPSGRRRQKGHFSVDPTLSGFENVIGVCRECGAQLTVNRATDLDGTFPSAGTAFSCFRCARTLRLGGDIANHPIDQIAYDAIGPMLRREYMQAVLMLAQSLEWALSMCVRAIVLGRIPKPVRLRRTSPFAIAEAELETTMEWVTLGQLRVIVARLATNGVAPTTVTEARAVVASLRKLGSAEPRDGEVETIADDGLRELVKELVAAKPFVKLRNSIAHHGVRPTEQVAQRYYEDIPRLSTQLLRTLCGIQGQMIMPPRAGGRRDAAR